MNINNINGNLIPFESGGEVAGLVIHTITGLFGALSVVIVLFATLSRKNNPSTILLLSLCWADLIFCLSAIIFGIRDLSFGGWSSGKIGCIIDSVLVTGGCFASVLTLVAVTVERYLAVMFGRTLKLSEVWIIIALIWSSSLVIALFPIYTLSFDYAIALQPGREQCTNSWWDKHPMTILMILICLAQSAVRSSGFQSGMQTTTAKENTTFSRGTNTMESSNSQATKGSTTSTSKEKEKKLLIKSIIICGTFVVTPYLIMILYSFATSNPIPSGWDNFVSIAALSNSAVNPILLVTLDSRIKSSVYELFVESTKFIWSRLAMTSSILSMNIEALTGSAVPTLDQSGIIFFNYPYYHWGYRTVNVIIALAATLSQPPSPVADPLATADVQKVKDYIDSGKDLNVKDEQGQTPLHMASNFGHINIVRILLEYNADIESKNSMGFTALHSAVMYGQLAVMKLLRKHMANIETQSNNGWTPLHTAAKRGHLECVVYLVKAGVHLDSSNKLGLGALHLAVSGNHLKIAKFLIHHGAYPDTEDVGYTPLHVAALVGRLECAKYLLQCGANMVINFSWQDKQNGTGNTPLHLASVEGEIEIVKVFLDMEADVFIKNFDNETALQIAHIECKELIRTQECYQLNRQESCKNIVIASRLLLRISQMPVELKMHILSFLSKDLSADEFKLLVNVLLDKRFFGGVVECRLLPRDLLQNCAKLIKR
ncbi:putative G-protein coupled receptor 63 [Terramyces sp. JEL0728]|nr:putative G-protein coupled receptor 63 [Terramyces sp. JEL0728]